MTIEGKMASNKITHAYAVIFEVYQLYMLRCFAVKKKKVGAPFFSGMLLEGGIVLQSCPFSVSIFCERIYLP